MWFRLNLVFNRRLILRFWMTIENNLNELLKSQKLRYEIENCQLVTIILRVCIYIIIIKIKIEKLRNWAFLCWLLLLIFHFFGLYKYKYIYIPFYNVSTLLCIKIEFIWIPKLTFIQFITEVKCFWTSAWKRFVTIDLIQYSNSSKF